MRLVAMPPAEALGAINVHTLRAGSRVIKKGRVLVAEDIAALVGAEIASVICARPGSDEVGEDAAAARIAQAIAGANIAVDRAHTGRANLRASVAGVFLVERDAIGQANVVDEAITVATVAPDAPVRVGEIIATVKIIPLAVSGAAVEAACDAPAALAVAPFVAHRAGLVLTRFTATHESVLDRAAHTQRTRLERIGSTLVREARVGHDVTEVAAALRVMADAGLDPILVMGASAIVDRSDVIPTALERAGGAIVRYGMPVDPGNLILLGTLGAATVIGLPGCARSLERSGYDWVLERRCAGLPITAHAMGALGVGGLIVDGPRLAPLEPTSAPAEVSPITSASVDVSPAASSSVDAPPARSAPVHASPAASASGVASFDTPEALAALVDRS